MSGHSKWANIKHQKGVADAKRGRIFTKIIREMSVAVRNGGPNPEANFKLRLAVQKARDNAMPVDHIERTIKRASGEGEGGKLEELVLEGYGPSGTAIMVNATTDNRNRTVQEVRATFSKAGGNLGGAGSVGWLFESKGVITIKPDGINTDDLMLNAIDAGAEDVKVETDFIEVYTRPEDLLKVKTALEAKKIPIERAEVSLEAKQMVALDEKAAIATLKLLDKLEDLDDVQSVSSNADFSDEVLEKYQASVP
jgi:YebC/PmpR family DNA-binding regulatory protein